MLTTNFFYTSPKLLKGESMKRRLFFPIILFVAILSYTTSTEAQNSYNVKKFSFFAPDGWKLYDHDVDYLIITSKEDAFTITFYIVENGQEDGKWEAIMRSLSKSYDFSDELTDHGGVELDCNLNLTYKFADISGRSDNTKYKFIWAQAVRDDDYTIIIFGICLYDKYNYYREDLWKIFEQIDYK